MRTRLLGIMVLTLASACAASRKSGYENAAMTASPAGSAAAATDASAAPALPGEEHWAKRADVNELTVAIQAYEAALATDAQNLALYERLARANFFLADAHMRNDKERQEEAYNKSIYWGERCMALDAGFKAKIDAGEKPENAADVLGKPYTGCIYWGAAALGKWAKSKGFTTLLSNKERIFKLITKVTSLDATYFYGAPDRYWGVYWSKLPGFMGRSPEKSETHFNASLQIAPNYFATRVLRAENLVPLLKDREQFKKLLNDVIAADPNLEPGVAPENQLEQEKAKTLLLQIDEIIPE